MINEASINMVLSTHSPYVLAKINSLLKAGSLSSTGVSSKELSTIVPEAAWLKPDQLRAYAIRDGRTESILDEDGLLSGSYLDEISNDISAEFLKLLELEVRSGPS